MDLRKRDLSNPLLRSSSLTSSSSQQVKVKISHGLRSTENKLLKKTSILSVAGKKKSSRTDETKGYSFLISDSALKRKLSDRVSPLSSIESASRYTLQSSSHLLVSKKTSDTKKRLILSTTQPRFHGLIESHNKQLPISKKMYPVLMKLSLRNNMMQNRSPCGKERFPLILVSLSMTSPWKWEKKNVKLKLRLLTSFIFRKMKRRWKLNQSCCFKEESKILSTQ